MLLIPQDECDQLISEFWGSVRSRLIDRHHRSRADADRGIGQYRHDVAQKGVGDLVYHQGVEKTAEVIDRVIAQEFPQVS